MQVDDVLELTRLGESCETPEYFQPASIAADIVDELQPLAQKSSNRVELVITGPFHLYRVEGLPIAKLAIERQGARSLSRVSPAWAVGSIFPCQ
ncbi:hypothetical protein [uncultured Roseovarius sp.]|uniref:hypothetical protein n=1 Tax=uncultured Roseovarius sp. TaxID=293344 RepID=UPI00261FB09F|nr:hypothetical protein [uncultured Roseovarius sp.]